MRNKNIDNLIGNLLSEEFEKKSQLMVEKLHGKQSKIDVAEPKGKIDAADFKMLRSMKKKETNEESEVCEQCGNTMTEGVCEQCQMEKEVEEGNAFTDALRKTKKGGKFKLGGKTYTDTSNLDEARNLIKRVYENVTGKMKKDLGEKWKGNAKVNKSSLIFTESEMVEIIEKLVHEEKENIKNKKVSSLEKLGKYNRETKSDTDKYMKELEEKMKGYLKTGSKGKYEMNPEKFPRGNGELEEMDKKAYTPSGAVEEYIENFAYSAGNENLDYDEIKPNEEWVDDNIKGSSRTGNNPKWANAVETELGEKIVKKKNRNLYSQEKKNSYKRAKQPVDVAGEDKGEKSLDKMFKTLESTEKKGHKINEEVNKMFNLISYNQKTQ